MMMMITIKDTRCRFLNWTELKHVAWVHPLISGTLHASTHRQLVIQTSTTAAPERRHGAANRLTATPDDLFRPVISTGRPFAHISASVIFSP